MSDKPTKRRIANQSSVLKRREPFNNMRFEWFSNAFFLGL